MNKTCKKYIYEKRKECGLLSTFHALDDEASNLAKQIILQSDAQYQRVEPNNRSVNATKCTIYTF